MSSETLYMSPHMDDASVLVSLSSDSSLRQSRFGYLVPDAHHSSSLEIPFPYSEKLSLRSKISKFILKVQEAVFWFGGPLWKPQIYIDFKYPYHDQVKGSAFQREMDLRRLDYCHEHRENFLSHLPAPPCQPLKEVSPKQKNCPCCLV